MATRCLSGREMTIHKNGRKSFVQRLGWSEKGGKFRPQSKDGRKFLQLVKILQLIPLTPRLKSSYCLSIRGSSPTYGRYSLSFSPGRPHGSEAKCFVYSHASLNYRKTPSVKMFVMVGRHGRLGKGINEQEMKPIAKENELRRYKIKARERKRKSGASWKQRKRSRSQSWA
nr:hypothetical protein Iba_chr08fCG5180 [Ipomoea batatas]